MRFRIFVQIAAILLILVLQIPDTALAHDGPARIELNNQQSSSGAELEIRGVNIAPEQPITLSLIGNGSQFSLGTAVGDSHGDFVVGVRVPAEALAGVYTVRAFGANRVVVAAPLTLVGSADAQGGERRDQSELMLAPLPPAQPAAPVMAAMPAVAAAPSASQESQVTLWPAITLLAIAAAAGLAIAARRRAVGALK